MSCGWSVNKAKFAANYQEKKMVLRVLKFGGTSVGSPERVRSVIAILENIAQKDRVVCVISAFSGVTDKLIAVAKQASSGDKHYEQLYLDLRNAHDAFIDALTSTQRNVLNELVGAKFDQLRDVLHGIYLIKELTPKTLDYIMTFGEWFACQIITAALHERQQIAEFVDARNLVRTNSDFGNAKVDFDVTNRRIVEYVRNSPAQILVVTGFCGATEQGETTTLGRSGSDYTAAIFGAALSAAEIEIWTDVNGVMTADPRKVPNAFSQAELSYEEALELSHFGAKVIYPPTMLPAMQKNIPIRIKNTFSPEFTGTVIRRTDGDAQPDKQIALSNAIKGITSIPEIALLRIEGAGMIGVAGIAKRLFYGLAAAGINVLLITQASSEHSICIAVAPHDAALAAEQINHEFELEILTNRINPPVVEKDVSVIAVVGENMRHTPGIAGKIFAAIGKHKINVVAIAQGSSELNISIVVSAKDEVKTLKVIHRAFFENSQNTVGLFVFGCGLVGSQLLEQLCLQKAALQSEQRLDLRIFGIANSKQMIFDAEGIALEEWRQLLQQSSQTTDLQTIVKQLTNCVADQLIFVDCTASERVAEYYPEILTNGISIATPNKKAFSGETDFYNKLKKLCRDYRVQLGYETTVGAGLPIIQTLRDLILSGDEILKIEGVLSGTLSYIFNRFTADTPFSQIVREAQEKGYTEPDPREDLNGMDVVRKAVILAREMGWKISIDDVKYQNLVPDHCQQTETVEAFYRELQQADEYFAGLVKDPSKKLCYIATIANRQIQIGLQEIDQTHPFYGLQGSENMVCFYAKRYQPHPLIVRGPGAGAAVTAAGVFADILKLSI
jgi:aspartokinase/homoserine dehydrogenase 1